jgi:hypothetical protein
LETVPVATQTGAEEIARFRGALRKLTDRAAGLRANAAAPDASSTPDPERTATPYERALIEPAVWDLLELDRTLISPSPAARANLPDGLALWLDALRAAARRFHSVAQECSRRAKQEVQVLVDQRQPDVTLALQQAIEALAVDRILATEETTPPGEEAAVLQALGVGDSPMLQRAVRDLGRDPELRRCVEGLRPPAADLKALAAPQLADYGSWTAWAHEVQ